jgi:adenine deaminase
VDLNEAMEKLRLGMTIFIREATGAKNLDALKGLFNKDTIDRVCLCTDDRHPHDLEDDGSINYIIKSAIKAGADPLLAIKAGTINPARYFGLTDRGAIAPGRRADLIVFSDLQSPEPEMVFYGGKLAAENGKMLDWEQPTQTNKTRGTMNVRLDKLNFSIPAKSEMMRVIETIPDQLVTHHLIEKALVKGGMAIADPSRDIIKLAVVERHFGTGKVGLGFIKGFGLKQGAIAGTVAHDHHNIVVAGADDLSMELAVREIIAMQGGMVVVGPQGVLAKLPLPIAGLMSDQPIDVVRQQYDALISANKTLGSSLVDPFMALSFMALSVIPSLKLTDLGLVDVDKFELTELFV